MPPCGPPDSFHNDEDFLVLASEDDPLTPWINVGNWNGSQDKCAIPGCDPTRTTTNGCVMTHIHFPSNWTTASDRNRSKAGQMNNAAMGVLLPHGVFGMNRTLVQMQPAYRCAPGSPLLARWGNHTDGCPQQFPNVTDIFGDGALGAHGGSGLSGFGGSIRAGELLPTTGPIRHALKLELQSRWYFGQYPLQKPDGYNGNRLQYHWPATVSSSCNTPGALAWSALQTRVIDSLLAN